MKKKLAGLSAAAVLLVLVVFAAACGSSGGSSGGATASPDQTSGVVKIGHIVDMTGPEAQVGTLFGKALNAANKQWPVIAGRKVQVITADAVGTPAGAVNAAKKLVETDHVVALIGPTQDGQKVAVANYVKQAHVPLILYNPSAPSVYDGNKWICAAGGDDAQDPTAMANYVMDTLKWKSMVVFAKDSTGDRAKSDPGVNYFTSRGGKVVQGIYVPESTSDFAPYFTTIKPADGIWAWISGSDAIGFWNSYVQTGVSKTMPVGAFFTGGFLDAFIVNNLKPVVQAAVNGTPGPSMYAPDLKTPANALFIKTMTPILGFPPDQSASASWQGYMVFKAALEKTKGNTDPTKLMNALVTSTVTGPEGVTTFQAGSNAGTRTVYILKVAPIPGVAGKYRYVTAKTYLNVPPDGLK